MINTPINNIKPYPKNTKKHPKKQIEQVARSIKEFGFNQPIVVDKKNVIIAGHGRYEAAKFLGMTEVPVVQVSLTPAKANAYRIADNKLNESDWEKGFLVDELKSLNELGFDISITGFSLDDITEKKEEDDNVPDVPKKSRTKLGDLYELTDKDGITHRILCGDSTDEKTTQKLAAGVKADLYLTDPPYNVAYEGKTKDALTIQNDSMGDKSFRKLLQQAFTQANAILKQGGVFYIWHADSEGYNFRDTATILGKVRQCLIWNKNTMVMGRQDYHWKHEPCLYGWKEGAPHLWNADRTQTTILTFDRPSKSAEHPTMKPVELFAYQIINNTKEKEIVFDNFLGSGTTLIAAQKTGRICYGIELDPKYVDVVIQRWVEYTGVETVSINGKKTKW